ncbi:probable apyrase 7 [Cynara cardunculus var. scolymus]|uniref:Nucleoside phosphatase GDA1/CD39 n=1 Tax=Cynara cardunculus var. scolymus TaxID=59895 RepID=A0A124SG01_CYNCS|nr:probable apyrase 7 [Cynara cardunculus var. scolymus]KVI04846.1 Nucleoside phosphatase GDA1/CD39 [Cynara cardunculus var. scolymus]
MVFSGIAEVFSSITSHSSAPKSSTGSYASSELPPLSGPVRGFAFPGSRRKNNLRLSSSLQDFSVYSQLDPEEGNVNLGIERISNDPTQLHLLRENGGTSFSKEKSPPRPTARRKWVRAVAFLVGLLLFASIIYALQLLYSNWSKQSARFFVVLDCGSTGTRVFVYQASVKHQKDGNLPILLKSIPEDPHSRPTSESGRAYNRKETEPGFDKLVHNVSGLSQAINPLLGWAEKQIPKHAHKTTSLFLYATAGVRRLPTSDSDWLLNTAWSIMKNSSFMCQREWVKIISGTDEAYYGWIALNYHTHMLGARPKKETYGALDLGGSSLQVTFEGKDYANNETSLNLSIGPVVHHLNGYSLAGYGLNDAFDKSVVHLLKMSPQTTRTDIIEGKAVIRHPCLQSGYKEQYICSQCRNAFQDDQKKLGAEGKTGIPVQLIGAPKWEECSAVAKITVNSSEWSDKSPAIDCDLQPCALQDNLPQPYGQFYAMSGFYVVYRFFNLSADAPLDNVLEKGRQFCEKSWDVAKNSVPPQPFIEQYCFRAPYIVLLLREGLHIEDSQVNIGSGGITWTTGVALLEAVKATSTGGGFDDYKLFEIKFHPLSLSAILLVSLCLVACALSRLDNCISRYFRRMNLPFFRHRNTSGTSVLNISSPFNYRRWSPIISGEGRMKTPLSPVAHTQSRAFNLPLYPSSSGSNGNGNSNSNSNSMKHSISSSSLQLFDTSSTFYPSHPHRGQMRLQSRQRSQSREDLNSYSLPDTHLSPKV